MTELTPEARDLLAAARSGDEPTHDDERRNHRALLAAIAAGGAATTAASAATASAAAATAGGTSAVTASAALGVGAGAAGAATAVGLMGGAKIALATLIVVGAVGGVSAVLYEETAPDASQPDRYPAEPREERPEVAPIVDLNRNPTEDEPRLDPFAETIDDVAFPSATTGDVALPNAPSVHPRPRPISPRQVAPEVASPETPVITDEDPLAAEAMLLRRAEAARARGDAPTALGALDEHRQRFIDGQLSRDREATRVLVLCDLGRVAEASALGRQLIERFPSTPLAARVQNSCAGDAP